MRKTPIAILVPNKNEKKLIPNNLPFEVDIFSMSTEYNLLIDSVLDKKYQVVLPMMHGQTSSLTPLLAAAEYMEVPATYSLSSLVTMTQRDIAKRVAMTHGMITPQFSTLYTPEEIDIREIDLPCVIKPVTTQMHRGVHVPNSFPELKEDIQKAFTLSRHVMVESFVEGREFSVLLYGNNATPEVFPVVEVLATASDELSTIKYVCPPNLTEEHQTTLQNLGRRSWKIFGGQGIMRVDFIYDEQEDLFYFLEVNTEIFGHEHALINTALQAQHTNKTDWLTGLVQSQLKSF